METAARPDPQTLSRLLDRLEPFATHPGTVEIHDPIYFLLSDPAEQHLANLTAALKRFPDHPLADEVRSAFGDTVEVEALTLEGVLAASGPIPPDTDPIREVQRRFKRHAEVRGILEARIHRLEREHDRMVTTTNFMTSLAAILAVFSLLGWSAALGWWEIPWLDPQVIVPEEPEEEEEDGR